MTEQDFLNGFAEIVSTAPGSLSMDTSLSTLEGWDSVAYLGTMVLLEEQMGVTVRPEALSGATTVGEIYSNARAQVG
jgi:acyl carrier protein